MRNKISDILMFPIIVIAVVVICTVNWFEDKFKQDYCEKTERKIKRRTK